MVMALLVGIVIGWFAERFLAMKDALIYGREGSQLRREDIWLRVRQPDIRYHDRSEEARMRDMIEQVEIEKDLYQNFYLSSAGTKVHLSAECPGLRSAARLPTPKSLCLICERQLEERRSKKIDALRKKRTMRPMTRDVTREPGAEEQVELLTPACLDR